MIENNVLSDLIVYSKYSRYLKDFGRRETWDEICWRNADMHMRRYPELARQIYDIYNDFVITKNVLPSMRSLQFGGVAIERNPSRIYNCAYLPIDHPTAFAETMFLLLGGSGVGYSVQHRHINKLPVVTGPAGTNRRFVIGDSIEGWGDAVKVLVNSYFYGKRKPIFDYDDIREKGVELVTSGGKAPGPDPLRVCLAEIESILHQAIGRQLTPIEAHDIQCHLADAVLAGGIRRAAMISLFDKDDDDMLTCKSGAWWEENPQRGRANNSVILLRGSISEEEFKAIWKRVRESGSGEPGIYWTNNLDWGTNPCCEIALRPHQFCNLTEINGADVEDEQEFVDRAAAAAYIGTLQAGYTNFHYLRDVWKTTTEEDALIGVGITGIAANKINPDWLRKAAKAVVAVNAIISQKIGINQAARTTTIKPSGTSSLVLGSSSGIHAYHNDYYIRRIRFGKDEPVLKYLASTIPDLIEDCKEKPHLQSILSIPQRSPQGASVRTEAALQLLERVRLYNLLWVKEGHSRGDNNNNVSCTISLRDGEWDEVGNWMWENRDIYNGISVLPYDGGTYIQAPFEDTTEQVYNELVKHVHNIDLTKVVEHTDNTNLTDQSACAGGNCEVV